MKTEMNQPHNNALLIVIERGRALVKRQAFRPLDKAEAAQIVTEDTEHVVSVLGSGIDTPTDSGQWMQVFAEWAFRAHDDQDDQSTDNAMIHLHAQMCCLDERLEPERNWIVASDPDGMSYEWVDDAKFSKFEDAVLAAHEAGVPLTMDWVVKQTAPAAVH